MASIDLNADLGETVAGVPTADDEAMFLRHAPKYFHLPLLLALWTGQRQGDLLRLPWSAYDGKQQGNPAKLGDVLVKIARMENPPKQFLAGSDALAVVTPVLEARLEELHAYEHLSRSTDGSF